MPRLSPIRPAHHSASNLSISTILSPILKANSSSWARKRWYELMKNRDDWSQTHPHTQMVIGASELNVPTLNNMPSKTANKKDGVRVPLMRFTRRKMTYCTSSGCISISWEGLLLLVSRAPTIRFHIDRSPAVIRSVNYTRFVDCQDPIIDPWRMKNAVNQNTFSRSAVPPLCKQFWISNLLNIPE